jgi:hypothetical protein
MPDPILQLQEIAKPCLNAKLYTYRAAADAERYLLQTLKEVSAANVVKPDADTAATRHPRP